MVLGPCVQPGVLASNEGWVGVSDDGCLIEVLSISV